MKFKILIVDDDNLVCISLKKFLVKLGFDVEICLNASEAFKYTREFEPDLILLDIYLSTHNGLDLLKDFRKMFFHIPVIMITGYSDVKIAVTAIKYGAQDFLLKPIDIEQLKIVIDKTIENLNLREEVNKLYEIVKGDELTKSFFGKSTKIRKLLNYADKLAESEDTTILLEGESGTGKEVFAKYIHQNSPRKNNAFVQINCSAIPKELAESELFGHEKGAFTGAAQKTKLGKFELANNGTILLDEIGELTLDLQVKLLRVLQGKKFYRLGGEKEISVNVRILAATNRSLEEEVAKGNFREDLFYRLNVARIQIPPLRERKEDIPLLALSFLKEFAKKVNKDVNSIDSDAIKLLTDYQWKGNIRELRNIMERAALFLEDEELKVHHLHFLFDSGAETTDSSSKKFELKIPANGVKIDMVLRNLIQQTLKITNGNQVKAAKVLGLSRSKLRYRMEQLGIEVTKNIS